METRDFGRLGRVSALTLGGGGIAGVWGSTDRAEAVATIHAATRYASTEPALGAAVKKVS